MLCFFSYYFRRKYLTELYKGDEKYFSSPLAVPLSPSSSWCSSADQHYWAVPLSPSSSWCSTADQHYWAVPLSPSSSWCSSADQHYCPSTDFSSQCLKYLYESCTRKEETFFILVCWKISFKSAEKIFLNILCDILIQANDFFPQNIFISSKMIY